MNGDGPRALRLATRLGAGLLASGAQTEDVEAAIAAVARGQGLTGVQVSVTFSTISTSWSPSPDIPPTSLLRLVRERDADFSRLADLADLSRRLARGETSVEVGEGELDRLAARPAPHGRVVQFLAPGLSATGATLMFGGSPLDGLATLVIAIVVQPALAALDRSGLPPFFRTAFGAFASAILVAVAVGIGGPIAGGIVLTGSLLRFLPGYALVSGFRDLVDQSIVSGTARLAEAVLLAGAVAGGTALALAVAASFGVTLSIQTAGVADYSLPISAAAALLAVGAYAVRLGVPTRSIGPAAGLGAAAWLWFAAVTPPLGRLDPGVATLIASVAIGALGRALALRSDRPASLWVVPAVLPLLPGLQIVTAMLAPTDLGRVVGLIAAVVTAFLIGVGVASGDIVLLAIRRIRDRIVAPAVDAAVDAVAEGVEVLVSGPVERAVGRLRPDAPEAVAPGVGPRQGDEREDAREGGSGQGSPRA